MPKIQLSSLIADTVLNAIYALSLQLDYPSLPTNAVRCHLVKCVHDKIKLGNKNKTW